MDSANYAFWQNSSGYFHIGSGLGTYNTYYLAKFSFTATSSTASFEVIHNPYSSYKTYMYAIFSNVNQTLTAANSADSSYKQSFYNVASSTAQTVSYTGLTAGETYFIYVKLVNTYYSTWSDSYFKFKPSSGMIYNPVNYYGYSSTLNNPSRDGYTFLGWTGTNGTTASTSVTIPTSYTGDLTYTANWQGNNYNLTYQYGGFVSYEPVDGAGYGFVVNADSYLESNNKGIHNSAALIKVNFYATAGSVVKFEGVYSGEEQYDYGIFGPLDSYLLTEYIDYDSSTEDQYYFYTYNLYSGEQFTVSYDITTTGYHYIYVKYQKDGSAEDGDDCLQFKFSDDSEHSTNPNPTEFDPSSPVTLVNPIVTGYTDVVWQNSSGSTVTTTPTTDGDATYSAVGSWIYYNITGDYITSTTYAGAANGVTKTFSTPTRTGYTFNGWTLGGGYISLGNMPSISGNTLTIPENVFGDITVNANWTANTYTITWNDWDGSELATSTSAYGTTPSYPNSDPTRASTAQYSYTFAGWTPTLTTVTGDATYTATYTETVRSYTISFVNYDGTSLQSSSYSYGSTPNYTGSTPTKPSTAQYDFHFTTWTPTVTAVTGEATYTAQFAQTVREYTITWLDEDGSTIITTQVAYGATPSYTHTKDSTELYDYTHRGWSPTPTAVTGEATYTSLGFDEVLRGYTITWWASWVDSTPLATTIVAIGETPVYPNATPTKASDAQYRYTFAGWEPEIVPATENASYCAKWTTTVRTYTITITVNNDTYGTVNNTTEITLTVAYGQIITIEDNVLKVDGETITALPATDAPTGYEYVLSNWSGVADMVTSDMTITANFIKKLETHTITIVTNNSNGTVSLNSFEVEYGTQIYTQDNVLTIGDYHVVAIPNESDVQYNYEFTGWSSNATGTVSADMQITASFSQTIRVYKVTLEVNSSAMGTLNSTSINVAYGTQITIEGNKIIIGTGSTATTITATPNSGYEFVKWIGVVGTVNGNITITAQFA